MASNYKKSEIIKAGMSIIARRGFNSTGIEAILRKADVPKGSFYHYFHSKQDFGLSVLDHFAAGINRIFDSYLTDESVSPVSRLKNCIESLVARFETNNCSIGCLAANMGQELADQSEEFRQKLSEIFRSWTGHFERCIREAQKCGEISEDIPPESIAEFLISGFEGALLISKVKKSTEPLRNFIDIFFDRLLHQPVKDRNGAD
jgi:TetR/AcrR family transcriptional repressor of nem operon